MLSAITPPKYTDMSPTELGALAAGVKADICGTDNDMREIDDLQQKGMIGAGALSSMFCGGFPRARREHGLHPAGIPGIRNPSP